MIVLYGALELLLVLSTMFSFLLLNVEEARRSYRAAPRRRDDD